MSSCVQTFLFFCENNCFQTAIVGAFVHIRNFLFWTRAPSSFVYVWMNIHVLSDVYFALFWVWIKHQVMHRLSCLFELESIFIHTGCWKLLCEHTCPQKCEGWIYVILKVGGGSLLITRDSRVPCVIYAPAQKRVVRTTERIIGTTLPTLQELYVSRVSKRSGKITLDPHIQHTPLNCYRLVDVTELWAPERPDTETVSSLRQSISWTLDNNYGTYTIYTH